MNAAAREPIFEALEIRSVDFRNRVWVPAMCQYTAPDGSPTSWHDVHYSSLATGVGCVIVEATAVSPIARVTPHDLVLDASSRMEGFQRLASLIRERGAVPGIQLSHAGRKGSRTRPWEGDVPISLGAGGWQTVGSSAIPFAAGYQIPIELDAAGLAQVVEEFARSAERACAAGFDLVEVHAGHGRLLHSFLSMVSNARDDDYGGELARRARLLREVTAAIRRRVPARVVLSVRLSCVDWCEGGLTIDDSVQVAKWLREDGCDIVNCSSGGIVKPLSKKSFPGYQVSFARAVRNRAGILAGAVGLIGSFEQANEILRQRDADVVLMGRRMLTDPLAIIRHAAAAGESSLVPRQYERALKGSSPTDETNHIPEL